MPPETKPAPYPTSLGSDAMQYLAEHGIAPRRIRIRSSDYRSIRSCPFSWYLSRKLGLVKASSYSNALSRGSWAHLAFACAKSENHYDLYMNALSAREQEIRNAAGVVGWAPETVREMIAREEKDCITALAWFRSALNVPYDSQGTTLKNWLGFTNFLSQEVMYTHGDCVIQPDAVVCMKSDPDVIWIVDFKTTAYNPQVRLQTCPVEFQTQHYFHVMQKVMKEQGVFEGKRLGGVIHVAVQKPTIEFGMKDRPYTLDTTPFKSGPRKGEPRNEKVYIGDPDPSIYEQRCYEWYVGAGEYLHLEPERLTAPCVNFSTTSAGHLLAAESLRVYNDRLDFCRDYLGREPWPSEYEIGDPSAGTHGLSPYFPFMVVEPGRWLDVIAQERFVQRDRDDAIIEEAP